MADRRAWGVCWLMFAATVLTYMDRQTVAMLGDPIKAEFGLKSNADLGWVIWAFYVTYALFQVPAGYLVDRWDLRRTYAAAVIWWSLAAVATSIAPSLGLLIACRALLGVGESFNWPTALRVTGRILPSSDRSLGNGIFNSGAAVGALITPAAVTVLAHWFGWRASFAVIGSAGFVWVAAWLILVRGKLRGLLAPPILKGPQVDTLGADAAPPRLPGFVAAAFIGVVLAGVVIGAAGYRQGLATVNVGIAVAIVGPLLVAAIIPRASLQGRPGPPAWARSSGIAGSGYWWWSRSRSTSPGTSR